MDRSTVQELRDNNLHSFDWRRAFLHHDDKMWAKPREYDYLLAKLRYVRTVSRINHVYVARSGSIEKGI